MMVEAASVGPTRRQMLLMLALSGVGFLASTNGISLSPFLLAMASEVGTDLGAISLLYTVTNLTAAVTAVAGGPLADRFGCKPVMLAGLTLTAVSGLATALAPDYATLVAARLLAGLGFGTQMPTAYAAAADLLPSGQRGKALGWVVTGQSLALVLGSPMSALLGAYAGWRWSIASLGLFGFAWLVLVALLLPATTGGGARRERTAGGTLRLVASRRALPIFAASALERVCYSGAVIFFATFLIATYGVPLQWVAGALVVVAIGNVVGVQIGGVLTDRVANRHALVAIAMTATGLLAVPLLQLAPGVLVSVGLALVYNLINALCRTPIVWLISQISRESRGALMGVQVVVAGFGWLIASSLGGWLVVTHGFGALGLLAAGCGLGSAACALLARILAPAPEAASGPSLASLGPTAREEAPPTLAR